MKFSIGFWTTSVLEWLARSPWVW